MKFHNQLIGEECINQNIEFATTSEREYHFSQSTNKNWPYHKLKMSYSYNEFGHRCHSIKELNWNNYLLFLGCSHSQGIGVSLENSYVYLTSKFYKMDYYNLAVSATGLDVLEYNLTIWLLTCKKPPKAVIIQWPDHSRFLGLRHGYTNLIPYGTWTDQKDSLDFIVSAEKIGLLYARAYTIVQFIKNLVKQPMLTYTYGAQFPTLHTDNYIKKIDVGRDNSHMGIKSHERASNQIIMNLKELL